MEVKTLENSLFNPGLLLVDPKSDFKPHWITDLNQDDYHKDLTAANSSTLKTILKSPFAFKRIFFDGLVKEPTDSMRFGTMAHMAILEGDKFKERYAVMPVFEGYTKDGRPTTNPNSSEVKAQKEAWLLEMQMQKRIILTQGELDKLMFMLDSVLSNSDAVRLLKNGQTEVSGYYADPETGIRCKIRPDFVSFDLNAMVDIKTVSKCDVDWFRRNRVEDDFYMYYFQMAMYDEGTSIITGKQVDYPIWILVENEAPYECIVVPMEDVYRDIGKIKYHKALRELKKCIVENKWERKRSLQSMHPTHWFLERQDVIEV